MRTIFLIGNGTSRRGFLLSSLRRHGLIVGCNKAYRDFPDFDFIVSIDTKPTKLVEKEFKGMHIFNNGLKTRDVYAKTLSYKICETPDTTDKIDSGKLATHVIKKFLKPDRLILIGMDFGGDDLYCEGQFPVRPNIIADWKGLLEGIPEVYRVGPHKQELDELPMKQISYDELEDIL